MGGNLKIGHLEADRIAITPEGRKALADYLGLAFDQINDAFYLKMGTFLWRDELIRYLAGSAAHLLNFRIPSEELAQVKPSLGDIDVMVNREQGDTLLKFLLGNIGQTIGTLTLLGCKGSGSQYITLWQSVPLEQNIQIDFILADFEDGKPTSWEHFIHSSPFTDLQQGIKGVAHKYIFRALTALTLHEVIIRPQTSRGKPKKMLSTLDAFSPRGYRTKLKPVRDENLNHIHEDGIPVYDLIPFSEFDTCKNLDTIFLRIFGDAPNASEYTRLGCYLGVLQIIDERLVWSDICRVADGMANLLWGKGAQSLYRDDPTRDRQEKEAMFLPLVHMTGFGMDKWSDLIEGYYV